MRRSFCLLALLLACISQGPIDPGDDPPIPTGPSPTMGFSQVAIGMTFADVIGLMGASDDTDILTLGSTVYMTCYWYCLSEYTYEWIYYYTVDFEDSVVVSKYSG